MITVVAATCATAAPHQPDKRPLWSLKAPGNTTGLLIYRSVSPEREFIFCRRRCCGFEGNEWRCFRRVAGCSVGHIDEGQDTVCNASGSLLTFIVVCLKARTLSFCILVRWYLAPSAGSNHMLHEGVLGLSTQLF